MSTRDAPHLRPIDSNAAVSWHHRRSDPSPQRNIDRPNHHRIWSESNTDHANDHNTCLESAAGVHGVIYPQQNEIRSPLAQEREHNELEVTLSFKNRDGYNGLATLDTGATDNWISDSLSRRLFLPRKSFREEVFASFEGKLVQSSESVDGHWHYLHQTIPVTFKICNDLAVEVVFGLELLRQVGLVDFEGVSKAKLNKVLLLAKTKAKKDEQQQNAAHEAEEQRKARKAERWQAMKNDKQWTWDESERRFWKPNGSSGTKIWTTEKW